MSIGSTADAMGKVPFRTHFYEFIWANVDLGVKCHGADTKLTFSERTVITHLEQSNDSSAILGRCRVSVDINTCMQRCFLNRSRRKLRQTNCKE